MEGGEEATQPPYPDIKIHDGPIGTSSPVQKPSCSARGRRMGLGRYEAFCVRLSHAGAPKQVLTYGVCDLHLLLDPQFHKN
ncbi:hypothetical protein GDO81_027954 [Engystomops pustulosus]|uniref:Uncharacterized protein n=1 Tax=Engystomops pustulosus TaxID=76066 RepID=A0AAV6YKG4_ENGPU|nr:hypothetical protein GDO81_027954 [Engystomops pustulosus]